MNLDVVNSYWKVHFYIHDTRVLKKRVYRELLLFIAMVENYLTISDYTQLCQMNVLRCSVSCNAIYREDCTVYNVLCTQTMTVWWFWCRGAVDEGAWEWGCAVVNCSHPPSWPTIVSTCVCVNVLHYEWYTQHRIVTHCHQHPSLECLDTVAVKFVQS